MTIKKNLKYLPLILAALALVELLFNASTLFNTNREGVRFNMPMCAIDNDEGVTCVVDIDWTHLTILNPDRTVRATIKSDFLAQNLPNLFSFVSMDNEFLYVTDHLLTDNGMHIKGERVLKYSLDGDYVSTLYTDTFETLAITGKIMSTAIHNGSLFLTKRICDSISVMKINVSDGTQSFHTGWRVPDSVQIMTAYYQPEVDALTYGTSDGSCFEYPSKVTLHDSTARIAKVVVMQDGSRLVLDTKNRVLVRQDKDSSETIICKTKSYGLWHNAPTGKVNHLFVCDEATSIVTSIDPLSSATDSLASAKWPAKHLFWWYLTLLCLVLLVLITLYYIVLLTIRALRKSGESDKMSSANLYGKPALFILTSFLITALLFSIAYYNSRIDEAISDMASIASSISAYSQGTTLGDAVKRVDSPDDFGNQDYNDIRFFCGTICSQKTSYKDRIAGFDVQYDIFRFDHETDNITYVYDHTMDNLVGAPLRMETVLSQGADTCLQRVRNGNNTHFLFKTGRGPGLLLVFSPIYDSNNEVVGFVQIINNLDAISQHIIEEIMNILLRIFTLLSVVLMAFVELKLLVGILKLRKEKLAAAGHRITICEGHRPIRVLGRILFFLVVPFITPYARQIAIESGISGDPVVLAALPLSFNGLVVTIGSFFMNMLTKKNPRFFCSLANILYVVVAVVFLLNHLYFRNFYLIVALMGFIGLAYVTTNASLKDIRFSNLKPDDRFSKVIFTNIESPIGSAIGVALGALIYDWAGIGGAMVVLIIAGLLSVLMSRLFIASDINAAPQSSTKKRHSFSPRYLLRLDVLACLLLVCVPLGFTGQFSSYVLPLYNESLGNTVLLVGFLTLVTRFLPLMISPSITAALKDKSSDVSFCIILAAMTSALLLFALRPTIVCLALTIAIFEISFPVMKTSIDKFQIRSAKAANISPSDMNGFFEIAMSVGSFVGPLFLASLISISYSTIGWTCGLICLALTTLMLLKLSFRDGSPDSFSKKMSSENRP